MRAPALIHDSRSRRGALRRCSALLAAALLNVSMAGCGKKESSHAELTMWLVGSEAQARTINQLAKAFTDRTHIDVRCEAIAWGEAHSKYLTAVAGGVQPDIGTMGLTWGVEFGRLGTLVDLRKAFPDEVTVIQQKSFPGMWSSIEDGTAVYGIPFDLTVQMMYYRTDLVPKLPEDWQELGASLERLRQEDRRMIIDWGSLSWIGYAPFLWQAGGDFYTPDKKPALNTPQAVQALEFFRDLYNVHQVPKTSIPVEQGLRTGEFPLAMSGNWKMTSLPAAVPEIAGKWAIGLLAKGPSGKRTAFLGGRILSVFANSKHQAEAWQFMMYLFEPDVQVTLYQSAVDTQDAYLPPNITTWDSLPMEQNMKTILKQQAQEAKGPPGVEGWNESTRLVEQAIQRVILHGADPKTELSQANDGMARALENAGKP